MTMLQKLNSDGVLVLVLFTISLNLLSASSATEKEILLQFKGNVSNDPSQTLASWVPSGDACNFTGVACNTEGNVVKIVLWNTSLSGSLSSSLSGLKSLRQLVLFGNGFSGSIPEDYGGISTLWKINLSSNALSGSIPDSIGNLGNLRFLDLSKNGFSGSIPSKLFGSCGKMKFISLSNNNLTGVIPNSVSSCLDLVGFDASYNGLNGIIPSQICDLPNLAFLSVRNNVLTGSVQDKLSGCHSMEFLDVSSNLFTGQAPFDGFELVNMTYLNVSHNGFTGIIPEIKSCSERMQFFDASGNEFIGQIPVGINGCVNLRVLDLEDNKLNGSIPQGIGDLKSLSIIRIGNNSLDGIIPPEIGSIELLQVLNLHNLNLHGEIPPTISNCRFLLELDIAGNSLDGEIPQTLYNLTYLLILDLHNNKLKGIIPSNLGSLSSIEFFDLSGNLFSGPIPDSLRNFSMLTHFNVSYNNLSGEIPQVANLTNFGYTAFFHNSGLCGKPLDTSSCSAKSTSGKSKLLSVSSIIAIVAAAFILLGVCFITILNIKARRITSDDEVTLISESSLLAPPDPIIGKLVLFSKSLPSRYEDWEAGTKALLDKGNLVGNGYLGSVYKASFDSGGLIAVKKLGRRLGNIAVQDEFEQDIGRLGNIHHPNLVAIQGHYWSSTMRLILSEFIPNSNLYDKLHGVGNPSTSTSTGSNMELNWDRRFKIALGAARALAYLHHDCKPPVLHLNMKSTNILLDEEYEAKLSDYGLGRLIFLMNKHCSFMPNNGVGYIAPEFTQNSKPTEKCDVYSFGTVLLELATGRKASESPKPDVIIVLCETVRKLLESGSVSDCFDKNLRNFDENELIQVMKLGLFCTAEIPSKRPSMVEVVQFLESIRNHSS
ncbi:hypothetical protein V2J09_020280 [Rumex salicifolius]